MKKALESIKDFSDCLMNIVELLLFIVAIVCPIVMGVCIDWKSFFFLIFVGIAALGRLFMAMWGGYLSPHLFALIGVIAGMLPLFLIPINMYVEPWLRSVL